MIAKVYTKYGKLDFGKYKGEILTNIIATDPGYIQWCIGNVPGFEIDAESEFELKNKLRNLPFKDD